MMNQRRLSESDLLVYYLAVDKKYYELLELYGLLSEFGTCPHCKHHNGMQYKVFREIVDSFGGSGVRVPAQEELQLAIRNITIWRGLVTCTESDASGLRATEYSKRYDITTDRVYKIRNEIQAVVDRLMKTRDLVARRKKRGTRS